MHTQNIWLEDPVSAPFLKNLHLSASAVEMKVMEPSAVSLTLPCDSYIRFKCKDKVKTTLETLIQCGKLVRSVLHNFNFFFLQIHIFSTDAQR